MLERTSACAHDTSMPIWASACSTSLRLSVPFPSVSIASNAARIADVGRDRPSVALALALASAEASAPAEAPAAPSSVAEIKSCVAIPALTATCL